MLLSAKAGARKWENFFAGILLGAKVVLVLGDYLSLRQTRAPRLRA